MTSAVVVRFGFPILHSQSPIRHVNQPVRRMRPTQPNCVAHIPCHMRPCVWEMAKDWNYVTMTHRCRGASRVILVTRHVFLGDVSLDMLCDALTHHEVPGWHCAHFGVNELFWGSVLRAHKCALDTQSQTQAVKHLQLMFQQPSWTKYTCPHFSKFPVTESVVINNHEFVTSGYPESKHNLTDAYPESKSLHVS